MSGIGLLMAIAKDALSAQRYGMDVTAHNIANVNTPGYSRQRAVHEPKEPVAYGGVLLGRGVDTSQVIRLSDQFVENRVMQQGSTMVGSKEMEIYMETLEGVFSEESEMSISALVADFWTMWHDVTNDPSGASARVALYEHSVSLAGQLNTRYDDLTQLETDLTNAVGAGADKVNEITADIAEINGKIVGLEIDKVANDLRDRRNTLVAELSEYLYVKTFDQSDGSLTVVTAKGCILVNKRDSYDLELGGADAKRLRWLASGGNTVDITNYITNGKLGAWLDLRDEVIAKYKLDLDAVAREFVWAVNEQHSQGVGRSLFTGDLTGTYEAGSSGLLSTLNYGQNIDYTKDFRMWIKDDNVVPGTLSDVTMDMGISTASVTNWGTNFGTGDTTYTIAVTQSGNISDSDGATKIKWREGSGAWSADVDVQDDGTCTIDGNTITFDSTEVLVAGNTFTVNSIADGSADRLVLTPSGTANSILDTYKFSVTTGGTIGTDTPVIAWSNATTSGTVTVTASGNYTVDGMTLNLASGTLVAGDAFTITTDADGTPTATLPSDWHWTLESFEDQFNAQATGVTASVTSGNALNFSPADGYSYGFCDHNFEDCGLLAALGINTFFEGSSAGSIGINTEIANKDYITAGRINNNVGLAVSAVGNTSTGSITTAGPYTGGADGSYTITIEAGGATFTWAKDDGSSGGPTAISIGSSQTIDDGVSLTFGPGTYVAGDTFTIAVTASSDTSVACAAGDNSNALSMTDLQYTSMDIVQWTCDRLNGNTRGSSTATIEDYYHSMVGSIGLKSESVSRARAFNEAMFAKMGEIRDSISAVSLDEEMTNIIKYQHAYTAAARLISVADEMLTTLLNAK
jgi:flagellar hook-associated protein FlgK